MGFKNYICKKASKSITIPGKGFIKLRNVSSDLNKKVSSNERTFVYAY